MSELYFNPGPRSPGGAEYMAHQFRQCEGKCGEMRPPERGVQIGQRWHCAACAAPILRRLR